MSCPTGKTNQTSTENASTGLVQPKAHLSLEQYVQARLRKEYGVDNETDPGEIRRWAQNWRISYAKEHLAPGILNGTIEFRELVNLVGERIANNTMVEVLLATVDPLPTREKFWEMAAPYLPGSMYEDRPDWLYDNRLWAVTSAGCLEPEAIIQNARSFESRRNLLREYCKKHWEKLPILKLQELYQASRGPGETESLESFIRRSRRVPVSSATPRQQRNRLLNDYANTMLYDKFAERMRPLLDDTCNEVGMARAYAAEIDRRAGMTPLYILRQFPRLAISILDQNPVYSPLEVDAATFAETEKKRQDEVIIQAGWVITDYPINKSRAYSESQSAAKSALKKARREMPEFSWEIEEERWNGATRFWVVGRHEATDSDRVDPAKFYTRHRLTVLQAIKNQQTISNAALFSHPDLLTEYPEALNLVR